MYSKSNSVWLCVSHSRSVAAAATTIAVTMLINIFIFPAMHHHQSVYSRFTYLRSCTSGTTYSHLVHKYHCVFVFTFSVLVTLLQQVVYYLIIHITK